MTELIHYRPFKDNRNVRCLNGSAHVRTAFDLKDVTCPICKDVHANMDFWLRWEAKHGNVNKK